MTHITHLPIHLSENPAYKLLILEDMIGSHMCSRTLQKLPIATLRILIPSNTIAQFKAMQASFSIFPFDVQWRCHHNLQGSPQDQSIATPMHSKSKPIVLLQGPVEAEGHGVIEVLYD